MPIQGKYKGFERVAKSYGTDLEERKRKLEEAKRKVEIRRGKRKLEEKLKPKTSY